MPDFTLHLGDCLEYMRSMPDKSVDCIVTDPPYGNGTAYNTYVDNKENLIELINAFMPEALRVADRVSLTCGVPNMWLYPKPTWVLNWTDPAGEGGCQWGFPSWQPILVYGKDPYLQNGMGRRSDTVVKRFLRGDDSGDHPCPKPVGFMDWLIKRVSLDGHKIFDPFMGSGTTGVSCIKLVDRKFVGCEVDPNYYSIAKNRIEQAASQMVMF